MAAYSAPQLVFLSSRLSFIRHYVRSIRSSVRGTYADVLRILRTSQMHHESTSLQRPKYTRSSVAKSSHSIRPHDPAALVRLGLRCNSGSPGHPNSFLRQTVAAPVSCFSSHLHGLLNRSMGFPLSFACARSRHRTFLVRWPMRP